MFLEAGEEAELSGFDDAQRERIMLGYFVVVAVAAGAVLAVAHAQPHATAAAAEEGPAVPTGATLTPEQATQNFPAAEVTKLRAITQEARSRVQAGDQAGARSAAKQLETTWDDDQATLQPLDGTAWAFLDSEIDPVLQAIRSESPDSPAELAAVDALIQSLG